jgi:hypothetical protein
MSGYFEGGEPSPSHIDQPQVPDWSPTSDSGAPKRSLSMRTRVVMVAVALSVVAAVGVVASASSSAGSVHAALATVSSSPTLKVIISARTTIPQEEAQLSQYSVAVMVTS